ncbi:MAG: 8-amino-7-oxononanoate synthase [Candidatus Brocadiia bacterium]|nr:MAG: 8-amino-7-oxononanoate synthase [Candidatus Brocadiia bacterium]
MGRFDHFEKELEHLRNADLYRQLRLIDSAQGTVVRIDGQEKILFCSNNYLGLACDERVIEAVIRAVKEYGHGAAASRLISGNMRPHSELEDRFARLLGKEAALIFPSGWMANEGVIKTLPQKGDLILLDKLDHASIVDAAKASDADFRTYRRGQYDRLEKYLADDDYQNKFIVTESIFSMDGDAADLRELVDLKKKHDAFLIVDEAHALGCFGKNGAGLAEETGVLDEVDIIVGTMSKAMGSAGGFVAGKKVIIDYLINRARSFIYTTSPTVANCAAAMAALDIIEAEPHRRERLRLNAEYVRSKLRDMGLNIGQSCSNIIPVIMGNEKNTIDTSNRLYEKGFYVAAIRPPTVAPGTSRLRLSIQSEHCMEQLEKLCGAFEELISEGVLSS